MEAMAAAAEQAREAQNETTGDVAGETEVGQKRKQRSSKVDAAEKKMMDLVSKQAICEAKIEQLQSLAKRSKRDEETITREKNKMEGFKAAIVAAEHNLAQVKAAAERVAATAAAKAAAAHARAEATKPLTEAGQIVLCELRGKYQSRFDNTSDKVDSIWAHIHKDFTKEIHRGVLPQSDGRSADAL